MTPPPPTQPSETWRVLIVDDNPDDRANLRRMLLRGSERRYRFIEADTATTGIRCILDTMRGGPPDCVILDVNLPDADALDVLAYVIGPDGPLCPFVIITGAANREQGAAMLRAGAQDYLGKGGMTAESLTLAVENAVERWTMARELRDRERKLRENEEQLRFALEASDTGLWTWNLRTDEVTWSPECYRIHGLSEGGFAGTGDAFFRLVHPEDAKRVKTTVRAAMAERTLYSCEFRIVRPSGEVVWVENRGRAKYNLSGEPLRMIGTMTDITARTTNSPGANS